MPKSLIRLFALVLFPCLVLDPTTASALSAPTSSIYHSSVPLQAHFEVEAFQLHVLAASRFDRLLFAQARRTYQSFLRYLNPPLIEPWERANPYADLGKVYMRIARHQEFKWRLVPFLTLLYLVDVSSLNSFQHAHAFLPGWSSVRLALVLALGLVLKFGSDQRRMIISEIKLDAWWSLRSLLQTGGIALPGILLVMPYLIDFQLQVIGLQTLHHYMHLSWWLIVSVMALTHAGLYSAYRISSYIHSRYISQAINEHKDSPEPVRSIPVTGKALDQVKERAIWVTHIGMAKLGVTWQQFNQVIKETEVRLFYSEANPSAGDKGIDIRMNSDVTTPDEALELNRLLAAEMPGHRTHQVLIENNVESLEKVSLAVAEAFDEIAQLNLSLAMDPLIWGKAWKYLHQGANQGDLLLFGLAQRHLSPESFEGGNSNSSVNVLCEIASRLIREDVNLTQFRLTVALENISRDFFFMPPEGAESASLPGSHLLGNWLIHELVVKMHLGNLVKASKVIGQTLSVDRQAFKTLSEFKNLLQKLTDTTPDRSLEDGTNHAILYVENSQALLWLHVLRAETNPILLVPQQGGLKVNNYNAADKAAHSLAERIAESYLPDDSELGLIEDLPPVETMERPLHGVAIEKKDLESDFVTEDDPAYVDHAYYTCLEHYRAQFVEPQIIRAIDHILLTLRGLSVRERYFVTRLWFLSAPKFSDLPFLGAEKWSLEEWIKNFVGMAALLDQAVRVYKTRSKLIWEDIYVWDDHLQKVRIDILDAIDTAIHRRLKEISPAAYASLIRHVQFLFLVPGPVETNPPFLFSEFSNVLLLSTSQAGSVDELAIALVGANARKLYRASPLVKNLFANDDYTFPETERVSFVDAHRPVDYFSALIACWDVMDFLSQWRASKRVSRAKRKFIDRQLAEENRKIQQLWKPLHGLVKKRSAVLTQHGIAILSAFEQTFWQLHQDVTLPAAAPKKGIFTHLGTGIGRAVALLFLPVAFVVVVALAWPIKRSSAGPVLLQQERVGYQGALIHIWKLRTMTDHGDVAKRRVTRLGRFLRDRAWDELPQLLSIVKGDMQWFGPRPFLLREINQEYIDHVLSQTKPGLISTWPLERDPTLAPRDLIAAMMRFDLEDLANTSVGYKAKLFAKTLSVFLKGQRNSEPTSLHAQGPGKGYGPGTPNLLEEPDQQLAAAQEYFQRHQYADTIRLLNKAIQSYIQIIQDENVSRSPLGREQQRQAKTQYDAACDLLNRAHVEFASQTTPNQHVRQLLQRLVWNAEMTNVEEALQALTIDDGLGSLQVEERISFFRNLLWLHDWPVIRRIVERIFISTKPHIREVRWLWLKTAIEEDPDEDSRQTLNALLAELSTPTLWDITARLQQEYAVLDTQGIIEEAMQEILRDSRFQAHLKEVQSDPLKLRSQQLREAGSAYLERGEAMKRDGVPQIYYQAMMLISILKNLTANWIEKREDGTFDNQPLLDEENKIAHDQGVSVYETVSNFFTKVLEAETGSSLIFYILARDVLRLHETFIAYLKGLSGSDSSELETYVTNLRDNMGEVRAAGLRNLSVYPDVEGSDKSIGMISGTRAFNEYVTAKQARDEILSEQPLRSPMMKKLASTWIYHCEFIMRLSLVQATLDEQCLFRPLLAFLKKTTRLNLSPPASIEEVLLSDAVLQIEKTILECHRQIKDGASTGKVIVRGEVKDWDEARDAASLKDLLHAVAEAMWRAFNTGWRAALDPRGWPAFSNAVKIAGISAHRNKMRELLGQGVEKIHSRTLSQTALYQGQLKELLNKGHYTNQELAMLTDRPLRNVVRDINSDSELRTHRNRILKRLNNSRVIMPKKTVLKKETEYQKPPQRKHMELPMDKPVIPQLSRMTLEEFLQIHGKGRRLESYLEDVVVELQYWLSVSRKFDETGADENVIRKYLGGIISIEEAIDLLPSFLELEIRIWLAAGRATYTYRLSARSHLLHIAGQLKWPDASEKKYHNFKKLRFPNHDPALHLQLDDEIMTYSIFETILQFAKMKHDENRFNTNLMRRAA